MDTHVGGERQDGRGARIGGIVTRLAPQMEDTEVDVVSSQSQDSLWSHLRNCGTTDPTWRTGGVKWTREKPIGEKDVPEEVLLNAYCTCIFHLA